MKADDSIYCYMHQIAQISPKKKITTPPNRRDNPPDCTYLGASRLSFNKCLTRQTNATYTQDNFTVVN